MEKNPALSKALKEARLNMGMTQQAFAKKYGINNATISQIENGRPVGIKVLNRLSKALKIEVKDLRVMMTQEAEE